MTAQGFGRALRAVGASAIALALLTSTAHGQAPTAIWVVGEYADADTKACDVDYASATAAVEAALRYNGVKVSNREAYMSDRAISAYVNLSALTVGGGCAVSLRIEFWSYLPVPLPASIGMGAGRNARVIFCNKSSISSGPKYTLQGMINGNLRDFTDQCISEMAKG